MNAKTLPSQQDLLAVLAYDPTTGALKWRNPNGLHRADAVAGNINSLGYRVVSVLGVQYRAHRVCWKMHHGTDPVGMLDHINGDKLDNRIENLREADHALNARNRSIGRNNRSGYAGVDAHMGRYRAVITVNNRAMHLGLFDTPQAAFIAYVRAKADLHPGALAASAT